MIQGIKAWSLINVILITFLVLSASSTSTGSYKRASKASTIFMPMLIGQYDDAKPRSGRLNEATMSSLVALLHNP